MKPRLNRHRAENGSGRGRSQSGQIGSLVLALLISHEATAFSQGSPICEVNTLPLLEMSPTLADPPPTGWSLSASQSWYAPGRAIRFQVRQSTPGKRALGILIWAKSGPASGAGQFVLDGNLFQYVPAPANCGQWALTHSNATPKPPEQLRFDWLAPAAPISRTSEPPLILVRAFLIEDCGVPGGCRAHQALTPFVVLQPAVFVDGFE